VARVLREDSGFAGYEVEAADLFTVLHQRLQPEALQHQQRLEFQSNHPLTLPNRDANLVLLILENLGHNALQAAPPGSALQVALSGTESAAIFSVIDSGPGLPMDIQERLFSPVISTKPGGTGIGLALSRQLARHMGADLRLVKTGSAGTEFALLLPLPRPTSA
jgi:signal transduction histidine kinase